MTRDRRAYKRLFFPETGRPLAYFVFPGTNQRIATATVVNFGMGGLALKVKRDENLSISPGGLIVLKEIKGIISLPPIGDIETEAVWAYNDERLKDMLLGCEFLDVSQAIKGDIQQFVNFQIQATKTLYHVYY